MMIFDLLFYCFSFLSLICAIMVILSSNAVHSVLFLILVFCNISGLLFLIGAEFIALMFIIVYVGAIAVLFLFVVMMLNVRVVSQINTHNSMFIIAASITFLLLLQLLLIIKRDILFYWKKHLHKKYKTWLNHYDAKTNLTAIGLVLYTDYSYLFILSSIILLIAMLGVIVLNLHQRIEVKKQDLSVQFARNSSGVVRFIKTIIND
uniref:NADH dehydrogenase subunit 6 n=1 Tax=Madagascaria erythrocladioides TaxID=753684 RepID=UPI001FCD7E2B|nr:NADH dehydrogenase subunit 6 [Madagascaria erythrocladioides]UNJ18787.1 NADH dehydrogenase subunit 6 [Madagascaria erythrocladioides]